MGSKIDRRNFFLRISTDIVLLNFSYFVVFVSLFLQLKILTNFLSLHEFGRYVSIIGTTMFISSFTSLGTPSVFSYFIPVFESAEEIEKRDILIMYGVFLAFAFYLIIACIVFNFFLKPRGINPFLFLLYSPYLLWSYFMTVLISMRRIIWASTINIISSLTFLASLYIFRKHLNINIIFLIYFIVYLFPIFLFFLLTKIRPFFSKDKFVLLFLQIRSFWKYAFSISLIAPFYTGFDRMILPLFVPYSEIAYLGAARRIDTVIRQILNTIDKVWLPHATYRSKQSKNTFFFWYYIGYILIAFFYLMVILSWGKEIISLLTQKGYTASVVLIKWLAVSTFLIAFYAPVLNLLHSRGNIKITLCSNVVWVFLYLVFFFFLAPFYGIKGAVWAWLFAHGGSMCFVLFYFFKNRRKWVCQESQGLY